MSRQAMREVVGLLAQISERNPALSAWETSSQHYYDSRGVARIYQMSLNDGGWKLWRDPDFW
jgi:hypothetical protein